MTVNKIKKVIYWVAIIVVFIVGTIALGRQLDKAEVEFNAKRDIIVAEYEDITSGFKEMYDHQEEQIEVNNDLIRRTDELLNQLNSGVEDDRDN